MAQAAPEHELVPIDAAGMITPAGTVDQAVEQFQLYQQLKDKLGTQDDFQAIRGRKHPKKSFVRKVQRFFNVSCEILRDEPLYGPDGQLIGWIATARAIHQRTGAYQDADGSCSMDEKAEGQQTLHNIRAHAITRAKNRAILDLVGFGDVSAEEMIDEEARGQGQSRPSGSNVAGRSNGVSNPNEPASEKQLKAIYAIVRNLDVDDDEREIIKQSLLFYFDVGSTKELTRQQASEAIDMLKRIEAGEDPDAVLSRDSGGA